MMPAFGNVAGKYYLYLDNWPFNPNSKEVTYHLFHNFGDAFSTLYSEIPQILTVSHDSILISGQDYFTVTVDSGALIALTVNTEILGTGIGHGAPVNIPIPPQISGDTMDVTITKQNFYRYSKRVNIVEPNIIDGQDTFSPYYFRLLPNYPNPFNPTTVFSWQLAVGNQVKLSIYDLLGREVAVPVNGKQSAGFHSFEFDGSQLASGVYLYRLEIPSQGSGQGLVQTRKMILMR